MRWIWIDRILELEKGMRCVAIKNVTAAEDVLHDHFPATASRPAMPVLPNSLIIEGMAQTAGALCMRHLEAFKQPPLVYFMAIDKARFRRPVVPGDTVHYHVQKMRNRGRVWRFRAQAHVDGTLVAEAEVSAVIVET